MVRACEVFYYFYDGDPNKQYIIYAHHLIFYIWQKRNSFIDAKMVRKST